METKDRFFDKRIFLGFALVLLGAVLLLQNTGIISEGINTYLFSWQALLIFIGILSLGKRNKTSGVVLIGLGTLFMIPLIMNVPFTLSRIFWPAILVAIGVLILFKRHKHPHWDECHQKWHEKNRKHWEKYHADHHNPFEKKNDVNTDPNYNPTEYINDFNFFSGSERRIDIKDFKGGKITSIFGGGNYDMLSSELAEGIHDLEIVNIFGGVKILIPSDWKLQIEVVSIFGGFSDKRRSINVLPENTSKILRIKGVSIFGGGEIKNV